MKRILFALLLAASPAFGDEIVKIGSTSVCFDVFVNDSSSSTGAGLTGLAHNTASLTAYYHESNAASATAITLVDMTVGSYTSSGFKQIDATNMPGWYQFCPPNASLDGGRATSFQLKGATNMAPMNLRVILVDNIPDVNIVSSDISISGTKGQR